MEESTWGGAYLSWMVEPQKKKKKKKKKKKINTFLCFVKHNDRSHGADFLKFILQKLL
jgi:hypothetical protein